MGTKKIIGKILLLSGILFFITCSGATKQTQSTNKVEVNKDVVNKFNADSAYLFVQKQVDFGPRIPKTKAHEECRKYLEQKFSQMGWQTSIQKGSAKIYTKEEYPIYNIVASLNPKAESRILLTAHYDTRPFADQEDMKLKLDGANDGGSGVAILLELARVLSKEKLNVGVDIILWDLEDFGKPDSYKGIEYTENKITSYCLGSMYWASHPHQAYYKAMYVINLDMVGAKDASFYYEGYSYKYARNAVDFIWKNAAELGYSDKFIQSPTSQIIDDHISTIKYGLPSVDIIDLKKGSDKLFFKYWHTSKDNMDAIDKTTLETVGKTLVYTILKESSLIKP